MDMFEIGSFERLEDDLPHYRIGKLDVLPHTTTFQGINKDHVRKILNRMRENEGHQYDAKKATPCSYSVYKHMLAGLRIQTVHCETMGRMANLQRMSVQLGNLELLNADVDAFIANETGLQRLQRYLTKDPNTHEYPGNYAPFLLSAVPVLGSFAAWGFGLSIFYHNREFKKKNPLTYLQRRFQQERVMSLLSNGAVAGLKLTWLGVRLFVPFALISIGLTIFANNTNPLSYGIGAGTAFGLNHSMLGNKQGFGRSFLLGALAGLLLGTGVYFFQSGHNQTQDVMNRETVKKKLYYESPSRYER